ncbi:hypothetical protein HPB47_021198 [Ixodes persulcatus]|uniref:Uncharacterized protein n=1 Tax=Ixodes persulcatus TaxID=34615 RepID=A0AC60QD88_IXOPE|nr:hypothetical protein HPB47_021198 [Ixodes persulcatus]
MPLPRTPPRARSASPTPSPRRSNEGTTEIRFSRRTQGLHPEFGLLPPRTKQPTRPTMNDQQSQTPAASAVIYMPVAPRTAAPFHVTGLSGHSAVAAGTAGRKQRLCGTPRGSTFMGQQVAVVGSPTAQLSLAGRVTGAAPARLTSQHSVKEPLQSTLFIGLPRVSLAQAPAKTTTNRPSTSPATVSRCREEDLENRARLAFGAERRGVGVLARDRAPLWLAVSPHVRSRRDKGARPAAGKERGLGTTGAQKTPHEGDSYRSRMRRLRPWDQLLSLSWKKGA